jgi:hypothetical protein
MDRSLSFGSTPYNLNRAIHTRFRFGCVGSKPLNLAIERKSQAHYAKGTQSHLRRDAPTVCRHMISGSISLPFRGSFHLSLTVLVHYRSLASI